jgi:hypothetical protein
MASNQGMSIKEQFEQSAVKALNSNKKLNEMVDPCKREDAMGEKKAQCRVGDE